MSITGSSSFRRPEDVALVVDLDELAPVGRWAPGRRDGGRLQRLAEVCENLVDGHRFGDERDEPDVATTQPGHSSGNSSPTRAVSFAQAIREVSCERGLSVAWFASQHPSVP